MLLATLQPSIFPFGIRIDEPVTTITDLLVTGVCFYAFIKLNSIDSNLRIHKYLKYYFLSMSIATLFGGIVGHGFLYLFVASWDAPKALIDFLTSFFSEELFRETANPWKLPGWLTSMVAVALLERATIENASKAVNMKTEVFFKRLNIIELLAFMTITFLSLNFKFVEIHSAYGIMFVVGSFSLFNYIKTKSEASKTYIIAVVIVIASSIIYLTRFSINIWFNYLDYSHTLMAIGAYVFYKGSVLMIKENKRELLILH